MLRVAEFEKVSYEQFYSAACEYMDRYGSSDRQQIQSAYDALPLPQRATSGSAGYDFKAPFGFTLKPGQTIRDTYDGQQYTIKTELAHNTIHPMLRYIVEGVVRK